LGMPCTDHALSRVRKEPRPFCEPTTQRRLPFFVPFFLDCVDVRFRCAPTQSPPPPPLRPRSPLLLDVRSLCRCFFLAAFFFLVASVSVFLARGLNREVPVSFRIEQTSRKRKQGSERIQRTSREVAAVPPALVSSSPSSSPTLRPVDTVCARDRHPPPYSDLDEFTTTTLSTTTRADHPT
jgi:hypothetical protein